MYFVISKLNICSLIEHFHSRVQQPYKFIGTEESVYIRKEFNSHRIGWLPLQCSSDTKIVSSCENTCLLNFTDELTLFRSQLSAILYNSFSLSSERFYI